MSTAFASPPTIASAGGMGISETTTTPQVIVTNGGGAAVARLQAGMAFEWPNSALMRAVLEIDRIQQNMSFSSGETTSELIRQGRAGAMYGFDPSA